MSIDIRMEFGVNKCASMNVERGSVIRSGNIYVSDSVSFRTLCKGESLLLFQWAENWRRPVVLTTSDRMALWKRKELHGRFHRAWQIP